MPLRYFPAETNYFDQKSIISQPMETFSLPNFLKHHIIEAMQSTFFILFGEYMMIEVSF